MSVIRVSRCGITRNTLSGKHVLTLIWMIMTGISFEIVSNWAVLTISVGFDNLPTEIANFRGFRPNFRGCRPTEVGQILVVPMMLYVCDF